MPALLVLPSLPTHVAEYLSIAKSWMRDRIFERPHSTESVAISQSPQIFFRYHGLLRYLLDRDLTRYEDILTANDPKHLPEDLARQGT